MDWSDIPGDVDPREIMNMYMKDNEFMDGEQYGQYPEDGFPYTEADYPYPNGEYDEDYMYDDYPYFDEDDYYGSITLSELLDQCIIPTMSQTINSVYPLLGLCLVTRLTGHFLTEGRWDVCHCSGWSRRWVVLKLLFGNTVQFPLEAHSLLDAHPTFGEDLSSWSSLL